MVFLATVLSWAVFIAWPRGIVSPRFAGRAAPAAAICFAETDELFINEWYCSSLFPALLHWSRLVSILRRLIRSRAGKVAAVFPVLVVGAYGAWSAPQRNFLMTRSLQPNRESVLLTRPSLDPDDPRQKDILTATFYGPPEPYDPNIIAFRNAVELGELVRKADAEGKAMYVNLGYLTTVEGEHQNKYQLLRDAGLFEDLGILPG